MVSIRVLETNGTPVSGKQVIAYRLGKWDFAITNKAGMFELPFIEPAETARVIIGGKSVYLGEMTVNTIYINRH